jgi:hypothetical protein
MIDGIINGSLLPPLSRGLLERTLQQTPIAGVKVSVTGGEFDVALT